VGCCGLTASAGIAGGSSLLCFRRTLNKRIGRTGLPLTYVVKLWLAAAAGAGAGWAIKLYIGAYHPAIVAGLVCFLRTNLFCSHGCAQSSGLNAVLGRVLKLGGRRR